MKLRETLGLIPGAEEAAPADRAEADSAEESE